MLHNIKLWWIFINSYSGTLSWQINIRISLFFVSSSASVDWHITNGILEIWKHGFLLIMCLIRNSYTPTSPGSEAGIASSAPDRFTSGLIAENLTHSTSSSLEQELPKQSKFRKDRFENVFKDFRGDVASSPGNGRECRKAVLEHTKQSSSLNGAREPFKGWTVGCMLNWPMPASPVYLNQVVLLPKSNTINSSCKSRHSEPWLQVQRDVLQWVQGTEISMTTSPAAPLPNISQNRWQQSLNDVPSCSMKHLSLSGQPVSSHSFAFLQYNQTAVHIHTIWSG